MWPTFRHVLLNVWIKSIPTPSRIPAYSPQTEQLFRYFVFCMSCRRHKLLPFGRWETVWGISSYLRTPHAILGCILGPNWGQQIKTRHSETDFNKFLWVSCIQIDFQTMQVIPAPPLHSYLAKNIQMSFLLTNSGRKITVWPTKSQLIIPGKGTAPSPGQTYKLVMIVWHFCTTVKRFHMKLANFKWEIRAGTLRLRY